NGTGGGDNGTIAIALTPTSATIQQGGTADVAATLTRGGGFGGVVNVTVEGVPAGVTGTVGNATAASATITINVAATTVPGVYNLTVRGTGTGVTDATAAFTLTVTATPAFALTLTPAALSIVQGGNAPTTVNLARTNFTAGVALTVEGAPAGVTSAFNPTPATAATSILTVTVAATVAPGVYNLTVRGTSAGMTDQTAALALTVTAPTPTYALSLDQIALSIVQGANAPVAVTITRTNFDGAVTLSLGNAPAGVTGAFNPAAPTGTASTLTVTVGAAVAPGVYNLTVDGTGTAGNKSTPLTLTVTTAAPVGNFSLTTTPATNVALTQGTNTPVNVNVVRTGGFVGSVALTVSGLVTGLTAAFNPASVTTNSSILTLTATGALPVGIYAIVIHGNSTGLTEQLVNLNVNVNAPSGSGNVTVNFTGCSAVEKPVWAAYQDGSGPWVRVTGTNDVYQFNIAQSKGGVAYVLLDGGEATLSVLYFSQAELTAGNYNYCGSTNPTGKTINGTVTNLAAGSSSINSFGGRSAVRTLPGAFQILLAKDGPNDLVGWMHSVVSPSTDRGFFDRGLNPADGGSFPNPVDYTGANSFAAAAASVTVTGTVGGETLIQGMSYYTGTGSNACTPSSLYAGALPAGSTFIAYGVPAANQVGTDYHSLSLISIVTGSGTSRTLQEDFQNLTTRAGSPFALPAALAPTVTVAGGPYKRLSVNINRPAEYNNIAIFSYADNVTTNETVSMTATAAYLGGSTVTLTVPDFSALAGWSNAWAPSSSDGVDWTFFTFGQTGTACQNGHRVVSGSQTGTTP
ncbi:MAG: hypothetical protein ABI632_10795, partial [Pseudolysinimonas sp.]